MTNATEKAIKERETRSRAAARKRGIGKYADGAFEISEYVEDEAADETTEKPKAKKS